MRDYKQALIDFNKSIVLDPGFAEAYNSRGHLYQELGDMKCANADFAKAKELGYKG